MYASLRTHASETGKLMCAPTVRLPEFRDFRQAPQALSASAYSSLE